MHEDFCTPGCRFSSDDVHRQIVPSAIWDSASKKTVVSPAKLGVHPEQNEKNRGFTSILAMKISG
jgi:hypothetical protein